MNASSEDIKDMLLAESALGLVFETSLFVSLQPSTPNDCVTVYDTPGFPPQLAFNQEERYYYPTVQVRVRSTDYSTGWKAANDIMVLLHGRGAETWNGTLYTVVYCAGGPSFLNWDENNRANFIINFNLQRR